MTTVGAFYSSDEYIKCLCADQSGKKINEVDKKAQESYIRCVGENIVWNRQGRSGRKGT